MKRLSFKKKIAAAAVAVIACSMAIGSTTAYFMAKGTARNVITTGSIEIALLESKINNQGEKVPFEDVCDVLPGERVSKIVEVENTGLSPAWIRASVEKEIILTDGTSEGADTSLVTFDLNTEYWEEADGFYYYKDVLKAGEKTQPLFTNVSFAKEMDNLYQNSKAIVTVNAYATQVANNGSNVFEAAGWPEAD